MLEKPNEDFFLSIPPNAYLSLLGDMEGKTFSLDYSDTKFFKVDYEKQYMILLKLDPLLNCFEFC